jgi:hypothetical protein
MTSESMIRCENLLYDGQGGPLRGPLAPSTRGRAAARLRAPCRFALGARRLQPRRRRDHREPDCRARSITALKAHATPGRQGHLDAGPFV